MASNQNLKRRSFWAVSAYYLKGITPPEPRLTQFLKSAVPFLFYVILSMVLMYAFLQVVFVMLELFYGR